MRTGTIGDVEKLGIIESFKVKQQILLSAAEAAGWVQQSFCLTPF
jgi:chaperonin GroEL (HSP60 family)